MRFSVNVDALYMTSEKDVYTAIREVAALGVKDIEFWGWTDKDLDKLVELKAEYELNYVGICPVLTSMTDPERKEEYMKDLEECIAAACKIGCTGIFVKPGDKTEAPYEQQRSNMKEILEKAAEAVKDKDMMILLEPVSFMEAPDTFLGTSALAFELVDEIGSPRLKVLYDLYHMQLDEGDITRRVTANIDKIGHIHAAGIMDRHELSDGEIDYSYVFEKIDAAGYKGLTGLEYFPVHDPAEGVKKVIFDHQYR